MTKATWKSLDWRFRERARLITLAQAVLGLGIIGVLLWIRIEHAEGLATIPIVLFFVGPAGFVLFVLGLYGLSVGIDCWRAVGPRWPVLALIAACILPIPCFFGIGAVMSAVEERKEAPERERERKEEIAMWNSMLNAPRPIEDVVDDADGRLLVFLNFCVRVKGGSRWEDAVLAASPDSLRRTAAVMFVPDFGLPATEYSPVRLPDGKSSTCLRAHISELRPMTPWQLKVKRIREDLRSGAPAQGPKNRRSSQSSNERASETTSIDTMGT